MKRVLSVLLVLVLMVGMIPISASAGGYYYLYYFTETGVKTQVPEKTFPQGGYTASLSGQGWSWDPSTKTLTLNGANVVTQTGGFILCDGATIVVTDGTTNTFVGNEGIMTLGDLTLEGKGKLITSGISNMSCNPWNMPDYRGKITFNGPTIEMTYNKMIRANEVVVNDGEFIDQDFHANYLSILGGTIHDDCFLESEIDLTIKNTSLAPQRIEAKNKCSIINSELYYESMYYFDFLECEGEFLIEDSYVEIRGTKYAHRSNRLVIDNSTVVLERVYICVRDYSKVGEQAQLIIIKNVSGAQVEVTDFDDQSGHYHEEILLPDGEVDHDEYLLNPSLKIVPAPKAPETLKATYTATKITLDGASITPKDANGKVVEPFAVDGTTYLPVRAVAGALGLNVDWDQATKTIKLTSDGTPQTGGGAAQPGKVGTENITAVYTNTKITMDGKPVQLVDANGGAVEPFAVAGTTYLPIRAISNALGLEVGWNQATKTVSLISQTAQAQAIYITPTGKRYHYNDSCNGGTYTLSTLAYAIQQGLTPCDKCVLKG